MNSRSCGEGVTVDSNLETWRHSSMRYLSDGYSKNCRPKGCLFSRLGPVDDHLARLGRRIRDLRTQRGWSQEQFADVCGVHRTYMGHLERGEKSVSFSSIVRVATALDVSLPELFTGIEAEDNKAALRDGPSKRTPNTPKTVELRRQKALRDLASVERALSALREFFGVRHPEPQRRPGRSRSKPE